MFSRYTFAFIFKNVNMQGVLDINQVKKKNIWPSVQYNKYIICIKESIKK